jgi:hypothetical protein
MRRYNFSYSAKRWLELYEENGKFHIFRFEIKMLKGKQR